MTAAVPEPDIIPVTRRADEVAGPPQGQWTYAAYTALPDDGRRYEVIDGVLYMTPAPNTRHEGSSARFTYHLVAYVELPGLGRVFAAPLDVQLVPGGTIVQPDLTVVLRQRLGIITPSGILGVPDLISEIASASTATYDRRGKMTAYERAGVPEYWIADPVARTVEVFHLGATGYVSAGTFQGKAILPSRVLPAFPVPVEQFFA